MKPTWCMWVLRCFIRLTYCLLCVLLSYKTSVGEPITYHGESEWVDASDIQETVLPGDEALSVDVQLIPDWQYGLIVLLVPMGSTETTFKQHGLLDQKQMVKQCFCILLVGKTDAEWIGRRYNQAHRGHRHIQSSRACDVPLTAVTVVLQDRLIILTDRLLQRPKTKPNSIKSIFCDRELAMKSAVIHSDHCTAFKKCCREYGETCLERVRVSLFGCVKVYIKIMS